MKSSDSIILYWNNLTTKAINKEVSICINEIKRILELLIENQNHAVFITNIDSNTSPTTNYCLVLMQNEITFAEQAQNGNQILKFFIPEQRVTQNDQDVPLITINLLAQNIRKALLDVESGKAHVC